MLRIRWNSALFSLGLCWGFAQTAVAVPRLGLALPQVDLEGIDGDKIRLSHLLGKPVLIIAESKASKNANPSLRAALREMGKDKRVRYGMSLIPVALAHAYNYWPVRGIAHNEIKRESQKEKIHIYCDWSGALSRALGLHADRSTVVFFNRQGSVIFGYEGQLPAQKLQKLISLINEELNITPSSRDAAGGGAL